MKNHWNILLQELNYKSGETIIDVGGAMDPVPIADVVVDIMDLGRGGRSYVLLDLCTDTLPFADKSFDICVCSQTLEDLACPVMALKEMSRIAKRGIVEVPHRGPESLKNLHYNGYPKPSYSYDEVWCFGTEHHKWLIEEIDGVLHFTFKNQMNLMRHPIPQWNGPGGIRFKWENDIPFRILYDIDQKTTDENYRLFREKNEQYWR